jgi:acetyl esterase/lipase
MLKYVDDRYFYQIIRDVAYETGTLPQSVHLCEDFQLTTVNRKKILMDIYYREAQPSSGRPAAIFIHGGGFCGGDKQQFQVQAAYLALRYNVFAVALNYRLNSEGVFPAALQDVKCAIRWVRSVGSRYHVNPDQIVLLGGSPGGNLAALAACTPEITEYEGDGGYHEYTSKVNFAVIFNGILDFNDFIQMAPEEYESIKQYLGGSVEEIPEVYSLASPLMRVTKRAAPMLLLHGRNDTVIPWQKSLQMHRKLLACGVPSEIAIFEGKGHGWFNRVPDALDALKPVECFLHKNNCL